MKICVFLPNCSSPWRFSLPESTTGVPPLSSFFLFVVFSEFDLYVSEEFRAHKNLIVVLLLLFFPLIAPFIDRSHFWLSSVAHYSKVN